MFWLLRKLLVLALIVFGLYVAGQYEVNGRPLKDYAQEFYESPLVQGLIATGQKEVSKFFKEHTKNLDTGSLDDAVDGTSQDAHEFTDEQRKSLEELLEK